jgi:hypothetical protein
VDLRDVQIATRSGPQEPSSLPGLHPGRLHGLRHLSHRYTRGNRHPGTNSILRLPGTELIKAGVRAGDLLAATEASARTIVVHCGRSCSVRYIAIGPDVTHAEGHIAFTGSGQ